MGNEAVLLILFIPVAIVCSILYGLLYFVLKTLTLLKEYFELIIDTLEGEK